MFIAYLLYLLVKSAHFIIDTCLYIDAVTRVYGTYLMGYNYLQRDMACLKLTLVNTEAGRPVVKKRKYANQHKVWLNLLGSILPRTTYCSIYENGKLILNLKFTCIQIIYIYYPFELNKYICINVFFFFLSFVLFHAFLLR